MKEQSLTRSFAASLLPQLLLITCSIIVRRYSNYSCRIPLLVALMPKDVTD